MAFLDFSVLFNSLQVCLGAIVAHISAATQYREIKNVKAELQLHN